MARVEKKYVVQADSKISDIYSKLNSVQKQTVSLFDKDRNGVLDRDEAKAFNNTVFSDKGDSVDCWIQLSSGKKQKVSVKKDELDTKTLEISREVSRKQIVKNGKKMNLTTKTDVLYEDNGSSLSEKFAENSRGYEFVSTDKNGNKKYIQKGTAELSDGSGKKIAYENYVILDVSGNVIGKSEPIFVGEGSYYDGKIITKGDKSEYYDLNNKKYGETQVNGNKTQYKDNNGKLLYSVVDHGEDHYTYYDENNKPLYEVKYYADGDYYAEITYLDKNGEALKTERAIPAAGIYDPAGQFKKPPKNPVEDGFLYL